MGKFQNIKRIFFKIIMQKFNFPLIKRSVSSACFVFTFTLNGNRSVHFNVQAVWIMKFCRKSSLKNRKHFNVLCKYASNFAINQKQKTYKTPSRCQLSNRSSTKFNFISLLLKQKSHLKNLDTFSCILWFLHQQCKNLLSNIIHV